VQYLQFGLLHFFLFENEKLRKENKERVIDAKKILPPKPKSNRHLPLLEIFLGNAGKFFAK
jgi:hypothetical protein